MGSRKRVGIVAVATGLIAAVLTPAVAGAANGSVPHHGSRPAWATAARDVGRAGGSGVVDLRVWIALRNDSAARALAAAVSNPASPQFGHYLTSAQFSAQYGQTADQAHAVAAWLRSAGLTVTEVPDSHQYVGATGSVSQVEKALSLRLDNYSVHGNIWRAPANDPSVPADVAASIAGFTGLDTGDHSNHPAAKSPAPPAGFRNAPPLSDYYGQKTANVEADGTTALPQFNGAYLPYAVKGYTPLDFRSAYGLTGTGASTTIAITDAYYSPTIVSDANTYVANHDSAAGQLSSGNYTETIAPRFGFQGQCDASGWQGEETLDVEVAHGTAPSAGIHYFGAASCQDPDLLVALNNAATDPNVDVVSNSWSGYEATTTQDIVNAYDDVFTTGVDSGKAFLFSSGDDGDELAATGTKQVDYPSSDPMVVAVGGTSIGIGQTGSMVGQTGWGTEKATLTNGAWGTPAFLYGSGGGCSTLFAAPSWQTISTGCASSHGRAGTVVTRGVPDISMDGDPTTGMLIGETQLFPHHQIAYGEYRIGGTSLASPLLAGVLALADGQASSNITGPAVLYSLPSAAITDVQGQDGSNALPDGGNVRADYANTVDATNGVLYSVRTFGQDSSLTLGSGWDQTTGLGTVNSGFVAALATALG